MSAPRKLSDAQLLEMGRRYIAGESSVALGKEYGVCASYPRVAAQRAGLRRTAEDISRRRSESRRALWADPERREAWEDALRNGVRTKQAKGSRVGNQYQIAVRFDDETFGEIRNRAVAEARPVAEIVRTLVEWGLESERDAQTEPAKPKLIDPWRERGR